ncbi:MAG TPA: hypothetical protein V6D00_10730 [Pantanalinema sp.]
MLSLWFWVLLWAVSTYWLVRVVGKPITEATRAKRAAAQEAAEAQAAEQALLEASAAPGRPPLARPLEELALGIPVADILERHGAPHRIEEPSDGTARWYYPMSVEGEDGSPVSGILVLDLEGGLLTGKTFEPQDGPSETEASVEASVPESEPDDSV